MRKIIFSIILSLLILGLAPFGARAGEARILVCPGPGSEWPKTAPSGSVNTLNYPQLHADDTSFSGLGQGSSDLANKLSNTPGGTGSNRTSSNWVSGSGNVRYPGVRLGAGPFTLTGATPYGTRDTESFVEGMGRGQYLGTSRDYATFANNCATSSSGTSGFLLARLVGNTTTQSPLNYSAFGEANLTNRVSLKIAAPIDNSNFAASNDISRFGFSNINTQQSMFVPLSNSTSIGWQARSAAFTPGPVSNSSIADERYKTLLGCFGYANDSISKSMGSTGWCSRSSVLSGARWSYEGSTSAAPSGWYAGTTTASMSSGNFCENSTSYNSSEPSSCSSLTPRQEFVSELFCSINSIGTDGQPENCKSGTASSPGYSGIRNFAATALDTSPPSTNLGSGLSAASVLSTKSNGQISGIGSSTAVNSGSLSGAYDWINNRNVNKLFYNFKAMDKGLGIASYSLSLNNQSPLFGGINEKSFASNGTIYTANQTSSTVSRAVLNDVNGSTSPTNTTSWSSTGSSPRSLAVDPSGNLYVANQNSSTVTKITPNGASYTLGPTGTGPRGITLDSKGNVYTANYGSGSFIGSVTKITPAGSSATFALTGAGPVAITVDSSDNIYTANQSANSVTKITPQGNVTNLGNTGSSPSAIVVAKNGDVYTANTLSNSVTKITASSQVTTNWASTGGSPRGITVDNSGNVYTANFGANNITRITPAGAATTPWASTGSQPSAIIVGQNNNIYTANSGSNNITQVTQTATGVANTPTTPWATTESSPSSLVFEPAQCTEWGYVSSQSVQYRLDRSMEVAGTGTNSIAGAAPQPASYTINHPPICPTAVDVELPVDLNSSFFGSPAFQEGYNQADLTLKDYTRPGASLAANSVTISNPILIDTVAPTNPIFSDFSGASCYSSSSNSCNTLSSDLSSDKWIKGTSVSFKSSSSDPDGTLSGTSPSGGSSFSSSGMSASLFAGFGNSINQGFVVSGTGFTDSCEGYSTGLRSLIPLVGPSSATYTCLSSDPGVDLPATGTKIKFFANVKDFAGNSNNYQGGEFTVDNSAPALTALASSVPGTVNLQAADNTEGSGLKKIYYRTQGSTASWQEANSGTTLTNLANPIEVMAKDNLDNQTPTTVVNPVAPTVVAADINCSPSANSTGWYNKNFTCTVTARRAANSPLIKSITMQFNNGANSDSQTKTFNNPDPNAYPADNLSAQAEFNIDDIQGITNATVTATNEAGAVSSPAVNIQLKKDQAPPRIGSFTATANTDNDLNDVVDTSGTFSDGTYKGFIKLAATSTDPFVTTSPSIGSSATDPFFLSNLENNPNPNNLTTLASKYTALSSTVKNSWQATASGPSDAGGAFIACSEDLYSKSQCEETPKESLISEDSYLPSDSRWFVINQQRFGAVAPNLCAGTATGNNCIFNVSQTPFRSGEVYHIRYRAVDEAGNISYSTGQRITGAGACALPALSND